MKILLKILLIILIFGGLIYSTYWLWQRQPKAKTQKEQPKQTVSLNKNSQDQQYAAANNSKSESKISTTPNYVVSGQTNPQNYVLIYSQQNEQLIKADNDGSYKTEYQFEDGLNFYSIVTISPDFKEVTKTDNNIYVLAKNQKTTATIFAAGSTKNIFDKVVTVDTIAGEQKLKINSSTKLSLSSQNSSDNDAEDTQIRVGDFLVSLGKLNNNQEIEAETIEIHRNTKPSLTKSHAIIKINNVPRNNLFSAQNRADSKLIELSLDKNTKYSEFQKTATIKSVAKDKTALIVYSATNSNNLVSFIYILD